MLTGKFIFLDIGSGETKILEAQVQQGSVALLKVAEMRDMSLFVSDDGVIRQIDGFCKSLKQTLLDANITSTSVVVGSSVFDISNKDITLQYASAKDCTAQFAKDYGHIGNQEIVYDWQYMGEITDGSTTRPKLYSSECKRAPLAEFIREMRRVGLHVVSIESSFTMRSYLRYLYTNTYDLPTVALVEVSKNIAHCDVYHNGTIISSEDISGDLFKLAATLSEQTKIAVPRINNLLYNVGVEESSSKDRTLALEGVATDTYYTTIKQAYSSFLTNLQAHLAELAKQRRLDNIQVIFFGGYLSMPKAAELVASMYTYTPHQVFRVGTTLVTAGGINVNNQLNREISPKFAGCIGLALRAENAIHTVNFCSKSLRKTKMVSSKDNGSSPVFKVLVIAEIITVAVGAAFVIIARGRTSEQVQTASRTLDCYVQTNVTVTLGDMESSIKPIVYDESVKPTFTYTVGNPSLAEVTEQGILVPKAAGVTYVVVHSSGVKGYLPCNLTVDLTVQKEAPNIKIADQTISLGDIQQPISGDIEAGSITFVSMSPDIIRISDNKLVPVSTGTATIAVHSDETDHYLAGQASFNVTVLPREERNSANVADFKVVTEPVEGTSLGLLVTAGASNYDGELPLLIYYLTETGEKVSLLHEDVSVSTTERMATPVTISTFGLSGSVKLYAQLGDSVPTELTVTLAGKDNTDEPKDSYRVRNRLSLAEAEQGASIEVPYAIEYHVALDVSATVVINIDGEEIATQTIVLPRTSSYYDGKISATIPTSISAGEHKLEVAVKPQGYYVYFRSNATLNVLSNALKLFVNSKPLQNGGTVSYPADADATNLVISAGAPDEVIESISIDGQTYEINSNSTVIKLSLEKAERCSAHAVLRSSSGDQQSYDFSVLRMNDSTELQVRFTTADGDVTPEVAGSVFTFRLPVTALSGVLNLNTTDSNAVISSVDNTAVNAGTFSQNIVRPGGDDMTLLVTVLAEDRSVEQIYKIQLVTEQANGVDNDNN